jgi:hypothetical protein
MTEIFRYFEFAEEKIPGVAESIPEMSCDVMSMSPGIPDTTEMEYPGSMGRGRTIHRPGFYSTSPSIEIGTDLKILSRMMYFALGEKLSNEGNRELDVYPDILRYYQEVKDKYTDLTKTNIPIPGHTNEEIGDNILLGFKSPFEQITVVVGSAKTDDSTLSYEYWDGSKWNALSVTDNSKGFTIPGTNTISFKIPSDKTGILWKPNEEGMYFLRIICTAFKKANTAGTINDIRIPLKIIKSTAQIYSSNNVLLPTFTGFFGIDMDEFQVPGIVMDKLELNVESEFITLKAEMQGMMETLGKLKTETQLQKNPDYPLAFYECDVHMRTLDTKTDWGDETLISPDIKKFTLSIENSAKAEDGQGLGSRTPYKIPVGERKIGFSFDYNYLTRKWYDLMQGGTTGPKTTQGSIEFEMMVQFDAGNYGQASFHFPRVIVTSASVESKGRDTITQSVSIDAYQKSIQIPNEPSQVAYTEIFCTFELYNLQL